MTILAAIIAVLAVAASAFALGLSYGEAREQRAFLQERQGAARLKADHLTLFNEHMKLIEKLKARALGVK